MITLEDDFLFKVVIESNFMKYFLGKGFCAQWITYKQKTQTTSSYKQPKITKTQN
jgi:hypothetical protein